MRITLSPFDTSRLPSKLTFTTSHVLPGRTLPRDFPRIPDDPAPLKWIKPLFDRLILQTENSYFMRSFCAESYADKFDRYSDPSHRFVDLGVVQKRLVTYVAFDQFTDDLRAMLSRIIDRSSIADPIHREALQLSYFICEHLRRIEADPTALPFEDGRTDADVAAAASAKIESTVRELQKKREKAGKSADGARAKDPQRQAKKITESELDELMKNIKQLKTSALIGVVEIIEGRPFSESLLPVQVNLKHTDDKKVDVKKLKAYVEFCKENSSQFYYSWQPSLPTRLQELHSKYESELDGWLRPPIGCPEPGVI